MVVWHSLAHTDEETLSAAPVAPMVVPKSPPTPPEAPPAPFLSPQLTKLRREGGDRVKTLAKQLEVALASSAPDASRTICPGQFAILPRNAHSSNGHGHGNGHGNGHGHGRNRVATHSSSSRAEHDSTSSTLQEGHAHGATQDSIRTLSPSKPGMNHRATQALHKLEQLYDEVNTKHVKMWTKMLKRQKSLFRVRGTFSAKVDSEHVVLTRLSWFWRKFSSLIESVYTQQATPGSMLASVLYVLVEARQVCLDIVDFGKSCNQSWRSIAHNKFMAHLLDTIKALEKQRDDLLYFVAHRRASRATAKTFHTMRCVEGAPLPEMPEMRPEPIKLSAIVKSPLRLLNERLKPWDEKSTAKLLPGLHKIEETIAVFDAHGYEDFIMLLFEADTFGKVVMDLMDERQLRRQLYGHMYHVFETARSNAIALLAEQGLDFV